MGKTTMLRAGSLLVLVAGAVAVMLAAPAVDAAKSEIPRGPHKAATMKYQIERLGKLIGKQPALEPPRVIDHVLYEAYTPKDNPLTPERVELGRKLYFETRLSKDDTVACATCHDVTRGFTDQLKVSEGVGGKTGKRNAPTTLNTALLGSLFLDGREPTLEAQARMPILNPVEMAMPSKEAAVAAIRDDPEYQAMFRKAYGRDVNYDDIGRAIGAFERTLIFVDSPFMRFLLGDDEAISEDAKKGWVLYNGKARCTACHPINLSSPLGTDNRFHNVGVSARHQDFEGLAKNAMKLLAEDDSAEKIDELAITTDLSELGRFMVTRNRSDIGAFRTPLILNIGITPPYMHDGSLATLWDVMDQYNKGGEANAFLDGGIEPLGLTESEIDQVVALLFSMTDDRFAEENAAQMKSQKAQAAKERPIRDEAVAMRKEIQFEKRVMGGKPLPGGDK